MKRRTAKLVFLGSWAMDPENGRYVQFGPFRLYAADKLLYRDGQLVRLPPKVVDTLLILVANHGHVVTKKALMQHLWPDTFVEEGALAQSVSLVRKALAEYGTWIENHPRRGYRFTAPVEQLPKGSPEAQSTHQIPSEAHQSRPKAVRFSLVTVGVLSVLAGTAAIWKVSTPADSEAPRSSSAAAAGGADLGPKTGKAQAYEMMLRARGVLSRYPTNRDHREASEILTHAIEADPDLADAYGWLAYAQARLYNGTLVGTETLRAAMSNANTALAKDRKSAGATRALVEISHLTGRAVEALVMTLRAFETDPEDTDNLAAAGEAYFRVGLYERAIPLYEKALAAEPENRGFRLQLARMHLLLGDNAKGLELISQLPLSQASQWGMLLYAESGMWDKAVEIARADRDRGLVGITGFFRGIVLAASGDLEGAHEIWEEGIRLGEVSSREYDNYFLHAWLSHRYAKLGEAQKARDHMQKSLDLDPGNPVILFFAAETEALLGNRQAAVIKLRDALENGFTNVPMVRYQMSPLMAFHDVRDDPEFLSVIDQMERTLDELRARF